MASGSSFPKADLEEVANYIHNKLQARGRPPSRGWLAGYVRYKADLPKILERVTRHQEDVQTYKVSSLWEQPCVSTLQIQRPFEATRIVAMHSQSSAEWNGKQWCSIQPSDAESRRRSNFAAMQQLHELQELDPEPEVKVKGVKGKPGKRARSEGEQQNGKKNGKKTLFL
jgi:hypothetical protein